MSYKDRIDMLCDEVGDEVTRAITLHPVREGDTKSTPTTTPHGGYAVIKEELDEFWEEVKQFNIPKGRDTRPQMKKELIQIAAMAIRTIYDCKL